MKEKFLLFPRTRNPKPNTLSPKPSKDPDGAPPKPGLPNSLAASRLELAPRSDLRLCLGFLCFFVQRILESFFWCDCSVHPRVH